MEIAVETDAINENHCHNQHDQSSNVKPSLKDIQISPKSKILSKTIVTLKSIWALENLSEKGAENHVFYKFKKIS